MKENKEFLLEPEWICKSSVLKQRTHPACDEGHPHEGESCGWYYFVEERIDSWASLRVFGTLRAEYDINTRKVTAVTFTPATDGRYEVEEGPEIVDSRDFWHSMEEWLNTNNVEWVC